MFIFLLFGIVTPLVFIITTYSSLYFYFGKKQKRHHKIEFKTSKSQNLLSRPRGSFACIKSYENRHTIHINNNHYLNVDEKASNKLHKRSSLFSSLNSCHFNLDLSDEIIHKRKKIIMKTILLNYVLFFVSTSPYVLIMLISEYGSKELVTRFVTPYSTAVFSALTKISIIINPFIYVFTRKSCKKYFLNYLFSRKKTQFNKIDHHLFQNNILSSNFHLHSRHS